MKWPFKKKPVLNFSEADFIKHLKSFHNLKGNTPGDHYTHGFLKAIYEDPEQLGTLLYRWIKAKQSIK